MTYMRHVVFLIVLSTVGVFAQRAGESVIAHSSGGSGDHNIKTHVRGVVADSGMVVCAHPEASRVGIDILKRGGNAVDAAIAVQFALAVVYPEAGNIAGGGFMVVRLHTGEINALDFREKAPGKAARDMYLGKDGNVVPQLSTEGLLSVGVPGSVDGMGRAHEKYGNLPWKDLLQPSVDLAANGFPITERQARELNEAKELFLTYSDSAFPLSLVKRDTAAWKAGEILLQKELAGTLRLIRDNGRDGFYAGTTANNIVSEMKRRGGLISPEDLQSYKSIWRTPIVGWYKGYKVISMAPPSSGGIALVQLLNMVESHPLGEMGFNSDKSIHLFAEAEKRVYADRAQYLGDPEYVPVPVKQLLDSLYIISRMKNYNPEKATPRSAIAAGNIPSREKTETTHFSIVDKWRNAVAVTTTLNGRFGSYVFVPGAGFLLNNEMDDFSVKPGVPNMYGLVGAEANAVAPGKRMLSSMTPTIIEKGGKPFMVVGTPGGSTIITTVFQSILDVIEYGMTMQEAVAAKKFHCQWEPDTIFVERDAVDSVTIARLEARGQHIGASGPLGRNDAILILPNGELEGAADPRGDDKALGY